MEQPPAVEPDPPKPSERPGRHGCSIWFALRAQGRKESIARRVNSYKVAEGKQ